MSLWIKICANTSLADAQLAADAGADAVGFVFAPSPRRVTESGIATPEDIARLRKAGFDAFLIGESLMRQPNPGDALAELLKGAAGKP